MKLELLVCTCVLISLVGCALPVAPENSAPIDSSFGAAGQASTDELTAPPGDAEIGAAADRESDAANTPTKRWRNLFVDVTNAALDDPGESSTYAGSVGANYTVPIAPRHLVALQLGGDLTFREDNPEFDVTGGGFARGLSLTDDIEAGAALLVDYRHTQRDAALFAARPTGGVDLGENDAVGVQGVIPLNDDTVRRRATERITQRITRRADVFWGHRWNETLWTEISGGFQFGDVDSPIFGGQIAYAIHPAVNLAGIGEINLDGDFAAGVSIVFDLGKSGQASTLRRFGSSAGLTPFPKRSFPVTMVESRRRRGAAGAAPAILPPGGGTPPGGNGTPPDGGEERPDEECGTACDDFLEP